VTKSVFRAPLLALGFGVLAFGQASAPPTKVGIIHIQQAIAQTRDGQKAVGELTTKYEPRKKELDQKQAEVQQLEQQYRTGTNTMSDEARQKLMRDIDQRRKQLQRDTDDAQAELQQDQDRVLQELGAKIMVIVDKYASEHGFVLILDVSSPQTPVLFASNTIDITRDIISLYDQSQSAGSAAPAAAVKPVAPAASAAPKN
jgi:outer membrane protein